METEARARCLAGWALGRTLGDSVSARKVAAAKVLSAYTRTTVRSVNAGTHCASAQRAVLIDSASIKNPRIPLKPLVMFFSNRSKRACLRARFAHAWRTPNHQSHFSTHAFLIVTQLLEIELISSQQRRKHFLFDTNERFFGRLYRIETPALSQLPTPHSPLPPSNRQSSQLKHSLTCRKRSTTLRPTRQKIQDSHKSHDNIEVRLLLLDTPSGTVCTGFDQGCKDRARKPFLAVIQ